MKKKWLWVLIIVGILVAFRIALPFIVKDYVNKTLREMEGYSGSVEDIGIRLFRGAYVIKNIEIVEESDSIPVPFVTVDRIDLSVHWKALLHGSIVGEAIFVRPIVNFAKGEGNSNQDGSEADWTKTLKELIPLRINRFEIIDGKIYYKDFSSSPKVDIYIEDLDLLATNLTNIESKDKTLPSTLNATGTTLGEGKFNVDAKLNILKKIPDLDLNLEFENIQLTALNDFIKAYTKVDVEEGIFSLYSEVVIDDKELSGYVKPVIENLKVVKWNKEEGKFLQKVWESIVAGVTEIFENQPKEQLATEAPLNGSLDNVELGIMPTLWNILKNAFVEALSKRVDNKLDFSQQEEKGD